jgi:hypothetical protein
MYKRATDCHQDMTVTKLAETSTGKERVTGVVAPATGEDQMKKAFRHVEFLQFVASFIDVVTEQF